MAEKIPLPEQQAAIDAVKNTVVAAGAGSGKTTVLAKRFSTLVTEHNINVDEILTLTFTKKATVEMSDRIYKVLKEKAPEQAANFYRANIKTLDSYCNSVAKMGCRFYGVSPDFTQDDETITNLVKAKALPFILQHRDYEAIRHFVKVADYENAAEKLFVYPILKGSTVAEPIDFRNQLKKQYERIVEEWNKKIVELEKAFDGMVDYINNYPGNRKTATMQKWQEFAQTKQMPESMRITLENLEDETLSKKLMAYVDEVYEFAFAKTGLNTEEGKVLKEFFVAFEEIQNDIIILFNYIYGIPFVKRLIPLMEEFQQIVMDVKRSSNCLTFKDISNLALCTLRDYPEIRLLEKKKYKAIMIDEFQDNNSDQRDMLFLLAEKMERMEKGVPSVEELMSEKLFFVGDEKQSIYRFRGADVEVFNHLSNDFKDGNLPMYTNHRSVPSLIAAFNTIFGGERFASKTAQSVDFVTTPPSVFYNERQLANGTEVPPYEAVYHNVLVPYYKKDLAVEPKIHIAVYEDTGDEESGRLTKESAEAEWVARKIKEKHDEGVEWSEIAILLQKYNFQNEFERALLRHGIPYVMESVRGLFTDGPVADMTAFMKTCAYERDTIAYCQVLRSPFVNLSLVEAEAVISLKEKPFSQEAEKVLQEDSLVRFRNAAEFFKKVQESFKSQTIAQTVSMLWYEGGYRFETMWNHTVEMYDKLYDILFELARQADEDNLNLASFVDSLMDYDDESAAVEMEIPLEKTEGVHIMSIHKSKGLEFDVVFLCNTHSGFGNDSNSDPTYFSKDYGFAYNSPIYRQKKGSEAKYSNYFYEIARDEISKKQSAEFRRVAYVALTRARNELYITNGKFKNESNPDEYLPGGEKAISNMWHVICPIVEFYEDENNRAASPFTPVEKIPSFERAEVYSGSGRKNTSLSKKALVEELRKENPYESTSALEQDKTFKPYVSPSKFHGEDEETGKTPEGGQVFASKDELGGKDIYPDIEAVRQKYPAFGLNNFGTIAHAYMEAAINGTEEKIPYSNRDIVALDGKTDAVKKIEKVCESMREVFKKSALGKSAMNSSWHKAEYAFRSRVAGRIISGSIDLVFENSDGTYIIVDYKTNQKVEPEIYYNQLACYKQAVSQMMNVSTDKVSCWLYYLRYDRAENITEETAKVNLEEAVKLLKD